jgi:predicted metal-dependent peptidase
MPTPNEIRDLVEQDRFELMMRCPFYGRIICSVDLVVICDSQVPLACTDYRRIFISGDAYTALPEKKRLAVIAHEVLHIALRHAFRIGERDKNRFEKAADIEVTCILTENFPDPYRIKCKEEWRVLTAEQIYEILPKREEKTQAKSLHCSPNNTSDDMQYGDDLSPDNKEDKQESKSTKSKSPKKKTEKQSPDANANDGDGSDSGGGGSGNGDDASGDGGGFGDSKQEGFSNFRPQFDPETEITCIALSKNTLKDVQEHFIGTAPAHLGFLLNKLDEPHVVWQVLLRQFIRLCRGGSYSWMRPNRRFISRGLYLPGRQNKKFSGIVALDTSASTMEFLPEFVAELTGLLKAFGKYDLTIIECDAEIQQVWTVSSNEPVSDLKEHTFMGGGGTNFNPVFEYIRDHHLSPNILIFFTDGYAVCPEAKPPYPVLWMLTRDGVAPVPWGQVIYY